MATFDFVESSASGYRFFWEERTHLLRLALIPFLIKLISFISIKAFGMDEYFLRQGLVLLPSFFAEGWLMAQVIRMAVFGERWPAPLSGDQKKDAELVQSRSRSILSATVIYVLIKLTMSFVSGMTLMGAATNPEPPAPLTMQTGIIGFGILVIMIWCFRFLWLYIPAALDYSVSGFLSKIRAYSTSIYMIGVWLLCFIPLAVVLVMASEILNVMFPGVGDEPPAGFTYGMITVQAVIEIIVNIITSVAMAFGIHSIYQGTNRSGFV